MTALLHASPGTARLLGATKRIDDPGLFLMLIVRGLRAKHPRDIIIVADDKSLWVWPRVREARL